MKDGIPQNQRTNQKTEEEGTLPNSVCESNKAKDIIKKLQTSYLYKQMCKPVTKSQ